MAKQRIMLMAVTQTLEDIKTMRDYTSQIVEALQISDELTPEMRSKLEGIKNNFSKIFFEYQSSYQKSIIQGIDGVLAGEFEPELQVVDFQDFLDELHQILTIFKEEKTDRTIALEEQPFVDEIIQLYDEIRLIKVYMLSVINALQLSNVIEMQNRLLIIKERFDKEVFIKYLPTYKSSIDAMVNSKKPVILSQKESLLNLFQDGVNDLTEALMLFDEAAVNQARSESTKKND